MFDRFKADVTLLAADTGNVVKTLKLTVYLSYQGKVLPFYTYVQPINPESEGAAP